jgi:hypothetical protein
VEDPIPFGKPPEDPVNSRKRSANFGNGEDIDLRGPVPSQFNGQTAQKASLPPPRLVNLPTTLNPNGGPSNRTSRFGAQVPNVQSPGLVCSTKLKSAASPPSFLPPKLESADVSSTTHEQIVIIPDPDLIISPVL